MKGNLKTHLLWESSHDEFHLKKGLGALATFWPIQWFYVPPILCLMLFVIIYNGSPESGCGKKFLWKPMVNEKWWHII